MGQFVMCLKCEILIIGTWNKCIRKTDGMVNLFFCSELNVGSLLFKEFKKFNESCLFSKAARMSSTYLKQNFGLLILYSLSHLDLWKPIKMLTRTRAKGEHMATPLIWL